MDRSRTLTADAICEELSILRPTRGFIVGPARLDDPDTTQALTGFCQEFLRIHLLLTITVSTSHP
jgi:hypothetical protein